MIYYSIHNKKRRAKFKHKKSVKNNNKVVNEVRQDYLRLLAFVSVGETFLFLFNYSKVHQKSIKWITNWSGCVLIDLKNPTQPTTLKTVERSSRNWSTKFPSSMASLHKNGFDCQIPMHLSYSEPPQCCQEHHGLYIFEVGINLPTLFQDMASNRAP
jgi:hypothetical protein